MKATQYACSWLDRSKEREETSSVLAVVSSCFFQGLTPFRKRVSEKLKKNWAPKKVFSKRSCLGPKKVAVRAEASCPMEHILYRMTGRLRSGTGLSEARC